MKNHFYLLAFSPDKKIETELYLEEWLRLHDAVNVFGDVWLFKSPLKAGDITHEITRQDAYAGRKLDGKLVVLALGSDWAHEGLSDQADALLRELSP